MTPSVVGAAATRVGVRPSSCSACTGLGPRSERRVSRQAPHEVVAQPGALGEAGQPPHRLAGHQHEQVEASRDQLAQPRLDRRRRPGRRGC